MKLRNIILSISVITTLGFSYELPKTENRYPDMQQKKQEIKTTAKPKKDVKEIETIEDNSYKQELNPNGQMIQGDVLRSSGKKTLEEEEILVYNKGFDEGYEVGKKIAEEEMIAKLLKLEKYLDNIFNFQRLYIENKIEPPKIVIRKSPVEVVENGKMMIIEQEQIEIVEPARLMAEPKKWKHFVIE